MNTNKLLRISFLLASLFYTVNTASAATYVGNGTPTEYLVTVSQVAFHKVGDPSTQFTTYASGTGQFDIASAAPGGHVGTLSATGSLSSGNYDQIRFTVSKTMTLTGASSGVLSNGLPCRTTSASTVVSDPFGDGSVSQVYLGATDTATPQAETTTVPSGSGVTLPSGITDLGSTFQIVMPITFSVTNGAPNVTVKFDVTNSIMFTPVTGATCAVLPGPPTVTVITA